jgi:Tfp pilus assembly protein PilF
MKSQNSRRELRTVCRQFSGSFLCTLVPQQSLICGMRRIRVQVALVFLLFLAMALVAPSPVLSQGTGIPELDDALDLHTSGNVAEAVTAYTEVLKKQPRSAEAYNWRGMAYEDLGDLDKALTDLSEALKISPNYADAHNNLGEVYRKKKMYPQAVAAYQKAIFLEPNFAEAHYNLALVYEHAEKKNAQAVQEYDLYLKFSPRAPDREAVNEKIKSLRGATAQAGTQQPAAQPGAKPGTVPPTAAAAPGTPAQPPAQAQPSAEKPGLPGARPGLPPTGAKPVPVAPPVPLPIDIPGAENLGPIIAMLMGFGLILLVVPLVLYLFSAFMLFLIAGKTGTSRAWLAFIPIAQYVLMVDIAQKPIWWVVPFLLPLVASGLGLVDPTIGSIATLVAGLICLVAWLLVSIGIAKARGKSVVWGILLFLPCTTLIALGYLGLSK